jgi:hypothetical protein
LDDERERRWDGECTAYTTECSENEESDFLMGESADEMGDSKDECASDECRFGRIYIGNATAL